MRLLSLLYVTHSVVAFVGSARTAAAAAAFGLFLCSFFVLTWLSLYIYTAMCVCMFVYVTFAYFTNITDIYLHYTKCFDFYVVFGCSYICVWVVTYICVYVCVEEGALFLSLCMALSLMVAFTFANAGYY